MQARAPLCPRPSLQTGPDREGVHELGTLADGVLNVLALLLRDAGVQGRGLVRDEQPKQVPEDSEAA